MLNANGFNGVFLFPGYLEIMYFRNIFQSVDFIFYEAWPTMAYSGDKILSNGRYKFI